MALPTYARVVRSLRSVAIRRSEVFDSDLELVARFVRSRDETAFRSLVNIHRQTLMPTANLGTSGTATYGVNGIGITTVSNTATHNVGNSNSSAINNAGSSFRGEISLITSNGAGNDLNLVWNPTPEPTVILGLSAIGMLGLAVRRREFERKQSS